jgi:hypothetical protein
MAFLRNFNCRQCGSSMGRWIRGYDEIFCHCFCCGACQHDIVLLDAEIEGLDYERILKLVGIERGPNFKILPRLNTPGFGLSAYARSFRVLRKDGGMSDGLQILNKEK